MQNPFSNINQNAQVNTDNSRKNTSEGESYLVSHQNVTNPNEAIKSPTKNGKYIDLSARVISPPNRHKPISYISTIENQKTAKNSFRKSNYNKDVNSNNNLYNISYSNNTINNNNNSNFNSISNIEPKNYRFNNENMNSNINNNDKFSTLQVKKIENYNSLRKKESEIQNGKVSIDLNNNYNTKKGLNSDKKNLEICVNQINLNLIDYNKIKNNTLTNFHSNKNSQEKELHGILKKSSDGEAFKSRYSLSNGFKDKRVTFHNNLVSYEKEINIDNKGNIKNNNLLINSELKNNKNQGYNFIDKNSLPTNNTSMLNRNNIYADKNIYNKNVNLNNNYVYGKNSLINSIRNLSSDNASNNTKNSGNFNSSNLGVTNRINDNKYLNYIYK